MKTINLLPKQRQQELSYESLFHTLWLFFVLSLVTFGLVFLAQFGTGFYLRAEQASLNSQIEVTQGQVDKNQNADIKKQIQDDNDTITDFKNLAAGAPEWSKALIAFSTLPPPGVAISSLNINEADDSVTINGFSPTRDLVIELYNNILADNKDFYNIDYPLDNLVNSTDVNFHFTFYIQDQLIQ